MEPAIHKLVDANSRTATRMRILLIHASKFSYHVTEKTSAVSSLAELSEDELKGSTGDVLVAFLASEKSDMCAHR